MAATTAAVPDAPKPISAIGRIIGAIVNPRPTFEDIARKPSWLAPLLLITTVSIVLTAIMGQRVDWVQVSRAQIEKSHFASSQIEKLPPDQQQRAFNRQATSAKIGNYVTGVVGTALLTLVLSAIYLGLFTLTGAGLKFRQAFSLVAYGLLPLGIKALLGIPIVLMKDPSAINPQNFIASNLGAFLPSDAPLWQITLGTSMDLFVLWSIVIIAIAFSAANPKKLSFGKAFSVIFGVFVAFTLIFTGLAAL